MEVLETFLMFTAQVFLVLYCSTAHILQKSCAAIVEEVIILYPPKASNNSLPIDPKETYIDAVPDNLKNSYNKLSAV